MSAYLKLALVSLVPVIATVVMYLLRKRTAFGKLGFMKQQLIIGVVFGLIAVFGTEYGVTMNGATMNARDAGPLCAGLIFGGPAGIIAGLIGGIERWFAAYWGAGTYSQLACSISTILCGFYAAALRKFIFDNKVPAFGFGIATGIVMEVVHLSIIFLTHMDTPDYTFRIIKTITLPMILANSLSVMFSIICVVIISRASNKELRRKTPERHIANEIQTWLLVCIALAYLATTGFIFSVQTGQALTSVDNLLTTSVGSVTKDVKDFTNELMLRTARSIAADIERTPRIILDILKNSYKVTEINVVNSDGVILDSTEPDYVGFDMTIGKQAAEFHNNIKKSPTGETAQDFQFVSYSPTNFNTARKYVGVTLSDGRYIQVGYDYDSSRKILEGEVSLLAKNRTVGKTGYVLITDYDYNVYSAPPSYPGGNLIGNGFSYNAIPKEMTRGETVVGGVPSYMMYDDAEGYLIIGLMPEEEAFEARDQNVYINSFMEILIFAMLFIIIYILIKTLVVNNLTTVNKSLGKIIHGDLETTVEVRATSEFSSLSDDINMTVTTLKQYIAEAAARIDKELEFAQNIQHSSLPSAMPAHPNASSVEVAATINTAKEVGGDFYDYYMLHDGRFAFMIADVSGKGIPAAMFMMRAKTELKGLAESGLPVHDVFTLGNSNLIEGNDSKMFVTAWMAYLDTGTGRLDFANAGHNTPLLQRSGQEYQYIDAQIDFVLGGLGGVVYTPQTLQLNPGDRIFLYTDGVTEAMDENENLFGEERLKESLNKCKNLSNKATIHTIREDLAHFVGTADQFDDITMVIMEYKG